MLSPSLVSRIHITLKMLPHDHKIENEEDARSPCKMSATRGLGN